MNLTGISEEHVLNAARNSEDIAIRAYQVLVWLRKLSNKEDSWKPTSKLCQLVSSRLLSCTLIKNYT
ncbi:hypothetical protein GN244_ATG09772 [Phytophthora infestans]|uniref:Uncharacterized protein n=1 Tax=Phytophthora infestans TaxID=4787 RepID=A0A833WJL8_PHYIN|nr:hypothetical protein GN244_ATG09772 [Phytophthora infestans]